MVDNQVILWNVACGQMEEEFGEDVVNSAVDHFPEAYGEIRKFVVSAVDHAVNINGFRSFRHAPAALKQSVMLQGMGSSADIAAAVICLWAEANQPLIQDLKDAAEEAELQFASSWTWEEAKDGFQTGDQIQPLLDFSESMAEGVSELEGARLRLAGLWLSGSFGGVFKQEKAEEEESDMLHQEEGESLAMEPVPAEIDDPAASIDSPAEIVTLDTMREQLALLGAQAAAEEETRSDVIYELSALKEAVENADRDGAGARLAALTEELATWQQSADRLQELSNNAQTQFANAARLRPDAAFSLDTQQLLTPEATTLTGGQLVTALRSGFEQIIKYDRTKQNLLQKLNEKRAAVARLQQEVNTWSDEADFDVERLFVDGTEEDEIALDEIRDLLARTGELEQRLENQCAQYRELSLNRIATTVEALREFDSFESVEIEEVTLLEIESSIHREWPADQLRSLEQKIVALLNDEMMKARATEPVRLAKELSAGWDEETFTSLLTQLSKEQWDVEALLLLLAANAARPRSGTLAFGRTVVSSLLRGIGQLSQKKEPFTLLSLLAPTFLSGWQPDEPQAQAELRIVFLGAAYSVAHTLPDNFLWHLSFDAFEWPVPDMPTWNRLWETTLNQEPIRITESSSDEDWAERVEEARLRAEQMLERQHGTFVRLNSIKSGRHHALLRDELFPKLETNLYSLRQIETQLDSASIYEAPGLIAKLESLLNEKLRPDGDKEGLEDVYDHASSKAGIHEDPFHRRTSLRVLEEGAKRIVEYGEALLENWRQQSQQDEVVSREGLEKELNKIGDLSPLAQATVEQVTRGASTHLEPRAEVDAQEMVAQRLAGELLSQTNLALRLPRVIGHLTDVQLEWEELLPELLADLAEPVEAKEAAHLLLERDAPNQVLYLTQYIPVEVQGKAQALKRENEREVEDLETALLKKGGYSEDLQHERELGRWRLVLKTLEERLSEQRLAQEIREQERKEKARSLRQRIHSLDDRIFEARDKMPAHAREVIEHGLFTAKRALADPESFSAVEDYLEDLAYRLERQAWALAELNSAARRLEQEAQADSAATAPIRQSKQVLYLLEEGELNRLGLSTTDLVTDLSKRNTRIELLQLWLALRDLPSFSSRALTGTQRDTIHKLFSVFARMIRLKRDTEDDSPVSENFPVVYERWKLIYPKTHPLQRACVLLAMPGHPPVASDLDELDYVLRDSQEAWLKNYFVILFIPGCTDEIRRRLESSYQNKGLVIIDEIAMVNMVLAEAAENNPLGRVRPMMLQAKGEKNVDVFKVNQTVSARTAIFVGRESLISRIASSGENYAIYGGRRIGKSSVLKAVKEQLEKRDDIRVVSHSFEGDADPSDTGGASALANSLGLERRLYGTDVFKTTIQDYLDEHPKLSLVFLIDEIDRYITANTERHVMIEALRALSDQYESRFRVVIAGFMSFYDCLNGRGPYTPSSDPWRRMLKDIGPLENLQATQAERIVREGFIDILGWKFANPAIPRRIVTRTGGHPAFVQYFCMKLQEVVAEQDDQTIRLEEVDQVFADPDPNKSFIAHVRGTLEMNLTEQNEPPVAQYLILWLAHEQSEAQGFTWDQMQEIADTSAPPIPQDLLDRALERLDVTSVIKKPAPNVYEFSVPDYPSILKRMGDTDHIETIEKELSAKLSKQQNAND